ncbi:hypothetical protein ACIQPQ_20295 [Streptomyces sp. NPDC091281]|uniref:hypothetical protein n=1 Tax=Streptomyces sp. NPDC091281 TaxID=3365985 RepID=UPI0037FCC061
MVTVPRRRSALTSLLLLGAVVLTACGDEKAGAAADPAALASRAQTRGIAPELVYATDVPGHTLAPQSVGVLGDDGFSATYVSPEGGQVRLAVDRGAIGAADCAEQPAWPAGAAEAVPVTCVRDGDAWFRSGGDWAEYALPKRGFVIRVSGSGVPRDTLREAADRVHRPTADDLDALLPPEPDRGAPVERGDLPTDGDGAPDNDTDAGG